MSTGKVEGAWAASGASHSLSTIPGVAAVEEASAAGRKGITSQWPPELDKEKRSGLA
ncbi:hypothetical protein [Salsuginibacillus kocurii]|uniref:hypothetical protein n=1 Tax=Salsuginibacillus kocurii TaxID=427078 RepID=UPI0003734A9D|nr:hypothetical protein [Salsuginibacillus kocurii]